jgi:GT2 family glycosyltransferase
MPTDENPSVPVRCSLIILNFNEADLLLECVESVLAASGPDDEVIVVDSASTDNSVKALSEAFPQVRLVALEQNRYIFGLNDGLARARGRFVAFCNNDMVVEPGFVEEALAEFVAEDIFAVCGRVLDRNGAEQGTRTSGAWKHGLVVYEPLPHVDRVTPCFFAVGGQSFYRRDVLVELGSIDELLWPMYHEDIELSYRAWKAGYRILYAPRAVCHHLGGQTSRKVFTPVQLRSFVRQNELLTVWKDVTDPSMLAQHMLFLPLRIAAALVRNDKGTLLGTWSALSRLRAALRSRQHAARHFHLSDRETFSRVSRAAVET